MNTGDDQHNFTFTELMKQLFILLLVFQFSISNAIAQMPADRNGGVKRDSSFKNMPRVGKVFGIVHDANTKKPVEFATVSLLSMRDSSVVGGGLTDAKGKFQIEELPPGRFKMRVSFIGYKTFDYQPIIINPQNQMFDVGVINFSASAKSLKEVEVTAEKNEYTNNIDKKVYNLDKNIVNAGGTATDVLQNIPSVAVDIDGNVALRGSTNVTIFIDGRPSGLSGPNRQAVLQQLPASAIEQIEVITNPSAKYDAEGMAGIINIKTKKEKMKGFNGNISVGIGTNDKYNISTGINNRTSKTNVFANYSYRSEHRDNNGAGLQEYSVTNFDSYSSETNSDQKSFFHTAKLGSDFFLDNYNTLTVSGLYSNSGEKKNEYQYYNFFNDSATTSKLQRYNYTDESASNADGTIDYKHLFKNSKREFSASTNFSNSIREQQNEFTSSAEDLGNIPYQTNLGKQNFIISTTQADYIHPLKNGRVETGLKATIRNNDNLLNASVYNPSFGAYLKDSIYSDHFIYNEQVYAAYLQYSGKLKSIDYSAGLRAEQALTPGDSKTKKSKFENDYFAFFPSASVKYTFKNVNEFQVSYSKRVNRPNTQALNPFIDYSDSLNLRSGNPELKPEYTQSMELAYSTTLDKWNVSTTLYYRHTNNLISRYRSVDLNTGVGLVTQINFNSSDNLGLESVVRYQLGKLGSVMTSFNIFQNKINASNIDADLQSNATNWNVRLALNLRVAKSTSLQVTGMYMAPMVKPQSTISQMMSGVDAGIKQDFWKNKASLNFNVTDIFDTRKFVFENRGVGYVYNGFRKRESRVAMLTFTYKFGSQDSNLFQRKKNQRQDNPSMEGGGDFGL